MYTKLKATITGVSPLLCHNGQLADPLNPHTKKLKEVSKKRNKTDADHLELARIEFEGSLYLNDDGEFVLPSEMLEAVLVEGARKSKLGKQALAGLNITEDAVIHYDGPKGIDALFGDARFRDSRGVRVGQAKVMRTRPKFPVGWSLTFEIGYLEGQLNKQDVINALTAAGQLVGVGDFRPKFGRFDVTEVVEVKDKRQKLVAA